MDELKALPIDFVEMPTGLEPFDPALYALVEAFCTQQFGAVPDFRRSLKSWAVVKMLPGGGYDKLLGVERMEWIVDCSLFHVAPPEEKENREKIVEELKERFTARDMLIARAKAYLEDRGYRERGVLIYIDPKMRQSWEKFFKRVGIVNANRVMLEV